MSDDGGAAIEDYYLEERLFPPPRASPSRPWSPTARIAERAEHDVEGFWAEQARALDWFDEWHTVLEWELPFARWFVGGTLNVSHNCLDRHVAAGLGERVAFHWEGEPGDTRTITYAELLAEVERFANVLKGLGVRARRPGGHLHADDPRAARGHAGLHAHRRPALGRLRRLLTRRAARPDQRRRGQGARHRRRRLAARSGGAAQGERRHAPWPRRRRSSTSSWCGAPATPAAPPP